MNHTRFFQARAKNFSRKNLKGKSRFPGQKPLDAQAGKPALWAAPEPFCITLTVNGE
jgi:hypothetical protein